MPSTCPRCGTRYETGWTCPTCNHRDEIEASNRRQERLTQQAVGLAEEQARAAEESLRLQEEELELRREEIEAQERHAEEQRQHQTRLASESWRLQAHSKYKQADKLLDAEMFAEALALAQDAIKQDPSHLGAYCVSSVSLYALGSTEQAMQHLTRGINLLRTREHASSSDSYAEVILAAVRLGRPKAVVEAIFQILSANGGTFGRGDRNQLAEVLLLAGLLDGVRVLWESTSQADLMLAGLYQESLARRDMPRDTKPLETMLDAFSARSRDTLKSGLATLLANKTISDETRTTIQTLISNRIKQWRADMEREWAEAAEKASPQPPGLAASIWAGIGVGFVGCWIVGAMVSSVLPDAVAQWLGLFGGVSAGIFVGRHIRHQQLQGLQFRKNSKAGEHRVAEINAWAKLGIDL